MKKSKKEKNIVKVPNPNLSLDLDGGKEGEEKTFNFFPLRKTQPNEDRKLPDFGVCDIEASNWINFLIIGFYGIEKTYENKTDCNPIDKKEDLKLFEHMNLFADYVMSDECKFTTIYAHFGGKYDFNFLIKEFFMRRLEFEIDDMIGRGSGLLCFTVSNLKKFPKKKPIPDTLIDKIVRTDKEGNRYVKFGKKVTFYDSSGLLPFSLDSITKNFGVEHKKQKIDYSKITKVTPELREYLIYDLKGLYQSLEKFFESPLIRRAGFSKTIASQAMKVYQNFMPVKTIYPLTGTKDRFVRESYFGGRTEIFKPLFLQDHPTEYLSAFDVNSLYPAVMQMFPFPNKCLGYSFNYSEDQMGFWDVEVEVPDMYCPPLGYVHDPHKFGKFIFPVGRFRGKWSTAELNYARSLGVKILKVYEGLVFENGGFLFKDYINHLYEIRKKSPKESVDNVLTKLLMNSTYGRFGLCLEREQIDFDNLQPDVYIHSEIQVTENQFIRLIRYDKTLDRTFTNVAIAAYVTSYSRILMHKLFMEAPDSLFYTDTDSLFSTHEYPDNAKNLGELKLEYKAARACFVLPKTYVIDACEPLFKMYKNEHDYDGYQTNKKLTMKGFDKKKISHFELEDFYAFLEGDVNRLKASSAKKFATFKTAVSKNKFLMLIDETERQIRSRYDKRRIIKRNWHNEYDTEPLVVRNGEIINKVENKIMKKVIQTHKDLIL